MKHIAIFQLKDHFVDYPETNRSGMPLIIDSGSSLMQSAGHLKLFNNPTEPNYPTKTNQIFHDQLIYLYIFWMGQPKILHHHLGWLKTYTLW